jgi:Asp-tRNA(Asn)/Glu-tRNA(Gln) amidotransferase A subunit family amidase
VNFTATELLDEVFGRIRQHESVVHAWTFLSENDSRQQARTLDALSASAKSKLPLFGVPIGIKDVIHVAEMPTRAGSSLMDGFVAKQDATCVARLRKAGAVILGKTATTEFAFYDPAPTRNPRKLTHTPGGSSSGSAAAVAAAFCPAAIGTQTFGSVIRPAAYCGVIGLKPSYRAISRDGVLPLAWSLDHVGLFSQTLKLAAELAEALCDERFPGERPACAVHEADVVRREKLGDLVIGIPDRYFEVNLTSAVQQGYQNGLQALRDLGARLLVVELPPIFEASVAAAGIILRAEAAAFHRKWFPERAAEYSPMLRTLVESGNRISAVEYLKARQVRLEAQRQMQDCWRQVDFLVTPSTPATAPEGLSWTGDPAFNTPFSILGNPAITLPAAYSEDGLPSGLQLVGRQCGDAQLLRLAWILQERGFGQVIPFGNEEATWQMKKQTGMLSNSNL